MQSLNKNGVIITQTPGEEKYVKCSLEEESHLYNQTVV